MRNRMLIGMSTVIVIMGCVIFVYRDLSKPRMPVLMLNSVSSIQVMPNYFTAPHPAPMHPNPKPIYPKDSQKKAVVKKVLSMFSKAKSLGYERNPNRLLYGPEIEVTLKNGKKIYASIPWLPSTTKQPDGRVLPVSHRSSQDVDIQIGDASSKVARYYSPELNSWIEGGWRKDVN